MTLIANPFCDKSDERLVYICKVATTFKRMDNSPKGRRMHSLTAEYKQRAASNVIRSGCTY